MKKTILKSCFLFFSIPLINSIAFGLGTLVHDMYRSTITADQFAAYQSAMIWMIALSALSIVIIEGLHDNQKINNLSATGLYGVALVIIAMLTLDQFAFRPFEHTLTFLSIASVVATRTAVASILDFFELNGKRQHQEFAS